MKKSDHYHRMGCGTTSRAGKSRRGNPGRGAEPEEADDWPLTPAQIRELNRRRADLDNPVRYLLVSRMTPRFSLYYNVSDDLYALNDPMSATLFKRRQAAASVKRTLGRGGQGVQVVECRTRRQKGSQVIVVSSINKSE